MDSTVPGFGGLFLTLLSLSASCSHPGICLVGFTTRILAVSGVHTQVICSQVPGVGGKTAAKVNSQDQSSVVT